MAVLELFYLTVFLGYFASFLLYFTNFELENDPLLNLSKRLMGVCLAAHLLLLVCLAARTFLGRPFQVPEAVCAVSFLVLLFSWVAESRTRARYLTLFSLPSTLLFTFLAVLLTQGKRGGGGEAGTLWFWSHLGFVLSAFACLLTSASSALMYLVQSAQLKSRHPGQAFLKLPALATLDRLHFRTLVWGVALFSLGIASGLVGANRIDGLRDLVADPRVLLSLLTCVMCWLILSFRLSSLRRGQKIAAGTVLIFVLFVVTWMSAYAMPAAYHKGL